MSGEMKKGISGIPASLPRIALRRILITTGSHTDENRCIFRHADSGHRLF